MLEDERNQVNGKRRQRVCHGDKVEFQIQGRSVWRKQDEPPNDGRQRVLSGDVGGASPLILLSPFISINAVISYTLAYIASRFSLDPVPASMSLSAPNACRQRPHDDAQAHRYRHHGCPLRENIVEPPVRDAHTRSEVRASECIHCPASRHSSVVKFC